MSMTFDSNDEKYFSWWCQELKDYGFIDNFKKGESYSINKPLIIQYE